MFEPQAKDDTRGSSTNVQHAVIPAAGYGARIHCLTRGGSKEMLLIGDRPVIDYAIEEAYASKCIHIGVVVRPNKMDLIEYLQEAHPSVELLWQRKPMGVGDAILRTQPFVSGGPFAVILPDDLVIGSQPATRQLVECYQVTKRSVFGLVDAETSKHPMFAHCGRPKLAPFNGDMAWYRPHFDSVDRGPCAVIGRYVFTPDFFSAVTEEEISSGLELDEGEALRHLAHKNALVACRLHGQCFTVGVLSGHRFAAKFAHVDA